MRRSVRSRTEERDTAIRMSVTCHSAAACGQMTDMYGVQVSKKPMVVVSRYDIGQQHLPVSPGRRILTVLFLRAWLRLPKLRRPELFTLRRARSP